MGKVTTNFHRVAMADFSRGFQSTERNHTRRRVASATIETTGALIQPSLTRRGFVAPPLRALKRTAKVTAPLRGKEVAA